MERANTVRKHENESPSAAINGLSEIQNTGGHISSNGFDIAFQRIPQCRQIIEGVDKYERIVPPVVGRGTNICRIRIALLDRAVSEGFAIFQSCFPARVCVEFRAITGLDFEGFERGLGALGDATGQPVNWWGK